MRLGIADHLGWAVAVTASHDHQVVDRRRLDLIEPGFSPAPIHYESRHLDLESTVALVAKVRASVTRTVDASLDQLAATLPGPIISLSLRDWPTNFPGDIAVQRRVPYEARADAVMYRQVLARLATERGWEVCVYHARDVEVQASEMLAARAEEVLRGPAIRLGPPWTRDHRMALAATVVAAGASTPAAPA